ncbi:MAG TPA: hypothetical protein VG273_06745 [Bryobacteraceae bacterium]|jgi:hypothetical protein|nr:hypothetical protein [Bryobacteraceae bacterium]
MVSREEVERILRQDVERKKAAYQSARLYFDSISHNIPSGLPSPDGTERIRNAGKDYRFSMREYDVALHDFNSFLCWGIIPEHLRQADLQHKREDATSLGSLDDKSPENPALRQ